VCQILKKDGMVILASLWKEVSGYGMMKEQNSIGLKKTGIVLCVFNEFGNDTGGSNG
jgi:hypothetical protein